MPNNFYCPNCRSNMNIENSLVLAVKSRSSERGMIFLDTELGNYERTTHPEFKLNEGEEYNFYCPVCHFKLNKEDKPNLVMLHMTDNDGKECEINISNIIGEQFTFQIKDKEVRAYGPHAELYKKYLDVPEEDRKYL